MPSAGSEPSIPANERLTVVRLTKQGHLDRFKISYCRTLLQSQGVSVQDLDTRWFKYERDDFCVNKAQFVPVIFEPPCTCRVFLNLIFVDQVI
jgi:hypothetical protein